MHPQHYNQSELSTMHVIALQAQAFSQWVSSYFSHRNTPLLQLTQQLGSWNLQRVVHNQLNDLPNDLSTEDISTIKQSINTAIKRASIELDAVFADQLLFLAVGAIQIQTQTQSDQAWQSVNQLIESTIASQKEKRVFQFSFITISALILMSLFAMSQNNTTVSQPPTPAFIAVNGVDPLTIEMIELTYRKMKDGTCQLPQAAMLPEVQRMAYLNFINNGVIKLQQVESLRLALGYVNCLYPQDLMRI